MLREILSVVIRAAGNFFSYLTLLRLVMLCLNMSFHSPIGLFILSVSNPLVLKVRRIIRPIGRFDAASLTVVWAVILVQGVALDFLNTGNIVGTAILPFLLASICKVVLLLTEIYMFATVAYTILSWISPRNQTMPFFMNIVRPAIVTIRKFVKPIAYVDISPLVLILLLDIIRVPLKMCIPMWW